MLDELRESVTSYLSQNRVCVIATSGSLGAWAVQFENSGLELHCRLPRWSDAFFHIEQEPRVVVIVIDALAVPLCWLQYRGFARVTDTTDERYATIHILPERIDLIDESRGWGERETLDV